MKRRRILRRAIAVRDLFEHAAYIAEDSPESALRFLDAAERSLKQLLRLPKLGARYDALIPALRDIRFIRVRGFENFLIFYLPIAGGIEIVRVLHDSRDIDSILQE